MRDTSLGEVRRRPQGRLLQVQGEALGHDAQWAHDEEVSDIMEQLGVKQRGSAPIKLKRDALRQERCDQAEQRRGVARRLWADDTPMQRELESLRLENLQLREGKAVAEQALAVEEARCTNLVRRNREAQERITALNLQVAALTRKSAAAAEKAARLGGALAASQEQEERARRRAFELADRNEALAGCAAQLRQVAAGARAEADAAQQRAAAASALRTLPMELFDDGTLQKAAVGSSGLVSSSGDAKWAMKQGHTAEDHAEVRAEAEVMALFCHPNLTPAVAWAESRDGQHSALVMPRAQHGSLQDIIKWRGEHPTSARARLALAAGACAGVAHMHSRGWAHYDLKPANVLAFSEGGGRVVARICDFGAARRFDAPSGLADTGNRLLGTVPFRHPLLLDSPHRAVAADVWGLLVTIRDLFACTGAWETIFTEVDDIREDPDREEDDLLLRAAERGWPRHMGPCGLPGCMMLAMRAGLARFPPLTQEDLAAEPWERPALAPLADLLNHNLTLATWTEARGDPIGIKDIARCLDEALAALDNAAAPAAA